MSKLPNEPPGGESGYTDGWAYAAAAMAVLRNWVLWLRLTITLVVVVVILVLLRSLGV